MTFPLGSLYHGTKFAVEGISESLRYEMEQIGCKVKIVEPGSIATDFAGRSFDFNHDENLKEYQPIVTKIMTVFPTMIKNASPVNIVSKSKLQFPDIVPKNHAAFEFMSASRCISKAWPMVAMTVSGSKGFVIR